MAVHAAAPAALWAAWDECTCAGEALLATLFSELRALASLLLCVCAFESPFRILGALHLAILSFSFQICGKKKELSSLEGLSHWSRPK